MRRDTQDARGVRWTFRAYRAGHRPASNAKHSHLQAGSRQQIGADQPCAVPTSTATGKLPEQFGGTDTVARLDRLAGEHIAPHLHGRQRDIGRAEIGRPAIAEQAEGQPRHGDCQHLVAVAAGEGADAIRIAALADVERLIIALGEQRRPGPAQSRAAAPSRTVFPVRPANARPVRRGSRRTSRPAGGAVRSNRPAGDCPDRPG